MHQHCEVPDAHLPAPSAPRCPCTLPGCSVPDIVSAAPAAGSRATEAEFGGPTGGFRPHPHEPHRHDPPDDDPDPMSLALAPVVVFRPPTIVTTGVPLFCLAPADGLAWPYAALVARLDAGTPVYGLQPPGLSGGPVPATVSAHADHALAALRGTVEHGPYRLLGIGFGGFVAYELATRLSGFREKVDLVVVDCDPSAPESTAAARSTDPARTAEPLLSATGPQASAPRPPSPDGPSGTCDEGSGLGGIGSGARTDPFVLSATVRRRLTAAAEAAYRAASGYRPSTTALDLTVVVPGRDRADPGAVLRHWRAYTSGQVDGVLLDADPDELTTPEILHLLAGILDAR